MYTSFVRSHNFNSFITVAIFIYMITVAGVLPQFLTEQVVEVKLHEFLLSD